MVDSRLGISFECDPILEITPHPEEESSSRLIIESIADLENVEPAKLPPLYNTIDPTVIDRLVEHSGTSSDQERALCFSYHGWNIFVRGDGTIVVGDPRKRTEPTPLF